MFRDEVGEAKTGGRGGFCPHSGLSPLQCQPSPRECSGVTSSGVGTHSVIPLLCVLRPAPVLGYSFPMHEMGVIHPLTVVRELNETSFGRLKRVGLTASMMSCKVDALRLWEREREGERERPFWNGDVQSLVGRVRVLEAARVRPSMALGG